MFTLEQIAQTHAQVKSGADFPAYVQDMKKLGVARYEFYPFDGHATYFGADGYILAAPPKFPGRHVSDAPDAGQLKAHLGLHQQGQSDFPTILGQVLECGVQSWTVDTENLTCTYYDKADNEMLVESIPVP